ncbi:DUF1934 domain-containing protein [Clostridium lacusfryxellense]|uniref:DUF1934 domain-containing protein n=1 Tax=Clostridium lacusfryxellense TaxID=205328 RepID=UPI001C0A9F1D|nr:DUF1934 domain-containing protein [Clostridium lacusfryxellense]MBU3111556.1 DUF1934 domain-containing protein [Clostridium lacusfryxellense]
MKRKAIISVVSRQSDNEDDGDAIEVVTPGEFYKKDNCYYAVYEETEISGMKGTTTTLKIDQEKFTLIRTGTTNTEMNFKKYSRDLTLYNTPHGALDLTVDTRELKMNIDNNGGEVFIDYDMIIGNQQSLSTTLQINIKV